MLLDDADTRLRIHQAHPATLDDAVKLAVAKMSHTGWYVSLFIRYVKCLKLNS
jgi:hypothetical protein